jgi:hypothetical protein
MRIDHRYEQVLRRRRRRLWAVSLLVAIGLAGCGSGKATSSATSGTFYGGSPLTPAKAFKLDVERTCKEGTVFLHQNVHLKGKTLADIAEVTLINQKFERKTVSELEKIKPPAQFAAAMKRIIGYRRSLAEELSAFAVIVRHNDKAKLPPLAKSKARLRIQLAQVAEKAGLKECAKVG